MIRRNLLKQSLVRNSYLARIVRRIHILRGCGKGFPPEWVREGILAPAVFCFAIAGTPYVPAALATTETAKLTAADGAAGDGFGSSVAMSGDTTVVVGGGSVYVFVRSAGTWTQAAKLTASDGAAGDGFGVSVAVSSDTVVVGAPGDTIGPNTSQGSAYVFVKPGGGWSDMTETAKLTASDGAAGDRLGYSVSVSGDTIIASGPESAYVFVKPGGGWSDMTQTGKLTASDGAAGDYFGFSVAISGDTVVVGAILDNIDPWIFKFSQGSAYVFARPVGGWADMTQTAKLTASDGADRDFFGNSVAVSGDTVVVGARYVEKHGLFRQGPVYLFVKPGGGWSDMTQTAKLTASPGTREDHFGASVAVSGDTVVVGRAYFGDVGGDDWQGSAYVFVKPGCGWADMTESANLIASDGAAFDFFGRSVAISGDTVIAGADGDDIGSNGSQGSAYIYDLNPVDPPLAAPAPHDRSKNRYVSFVPSNGPDLVAFKIDKTTAPVGTAWVGTPDANGLAPVENAPVPRVWPEAVVHVGDCEIVPVATYNIWATADGGGTFSSPLTVSTTAQPAPKFWGDTVGGFGNVVADEWDPPNGVVNVNDYVAALQAFLGVSTAPHVTVVDVQTVSSTDPCLNRIANIADVFLIIKAFYGNVYPFETDPALCPPCP